MTTNARPIRYRVMVPTELASGITFPEISGKNAAKIPIRLAPLNEQRRIVAKLERLLSRVHAAQTRLATIPRILKRFRQSVLAAACSGRLTADWREANPDAEPGDELVNRIRGAIIDRYKRESTTAENNRGRKPKSPKALVDLKPDALVLPDIPLKWSWSYLQNLGEFYKRRIKTSSKK